jgi:hypothetical protein
MHRQKSSFLISLAALLLIGGTLLHVTLITASPLAALPAPTTSLYDYDFNNGSYNGWQEVTGTWTVSSGSLYGNYGCAAVNDPLPRIITGNSAWENIQFSFDINVQNSDEAAASALFRFAGQGFYRLAINPAAGITPDSGAIILYRNDPDTGLETELQRTTAFALSLATWYNFTVKVYGSDIEIWLANPADTLVLSSTDPDPLPPGRVGFQVESLAACPTHQVWYDNVTVQAIDPQYPANLALNRHVTVSASQDGSYNPAFMVDGDHTTRWSSPFSDPQWVYVDLGVTSAIGEARLWWEAPGRHYRIDFSDDAVNWQTMYEQTSGDGSLDVIPLSGVARYVRMYGLERGSPWGYSLFEFEIAERPTLFVDNFNDGDYQNWLPVKGNWYVNNGALGAVYPCQGGEFYKIVAGAYEWKNYEFSFDMKRLQGWDAGGAIFRYSPNGYYRLEVHPNTYYGGSFRLMRVNSANEETWFVDQPASFDAASWHRFRVRLYGPRIQVWVVNPPNDILLVDYMDPNPLLNGKIGFLEAAGAICPTEVIHDNVEVDAVLPPAPLLYQPADGPLAIGQQPVFTWQGYGPSIDHYELQLDTVNPPQRTYTIDAGNNVGPVTYDASGPFLMTTYYWRVRAVEQDVSHISPWSEIRSVTLLSQNVAAPSRNLYTALPATLAWNAVSWANGYEIEVAHDSGFESIAERYWPSTSVLSIPINLPNGGYYWHIHAQKADGSWGQWSGTESFIIAVP